MQKNNKFSKDERLKSSKIIKEIFANGEKKANKIAVVIVAQNKLTIPRIAVFAGKKLGNAVLRNKIKRQIRAIFRQNKNKFTPGSDYIIIAKEKIKKTKYIDIEKAIFSLVING